MTNPRDTDTRRDRLRKVCAILRDGTGLPVQVSIGKGGIVGLWMSLEDTERWLENEIGENE